MSNKTVVYQGPGFCTLLGLVFIVLKLCNVINWSWWWVTAPLWIPAGICFAILAVLGLVLAITALIAICKS